MINSSPPLSLLLLGILASWFLLLGLLNAAPQFGTGNHRLITKETSIGKVPLMAVMNELLISPDCRHIAFPVRRGGKWTVSLDGVEGEKYDRATPFKFSLDIRQFAYPVERGSKWEVILDGKAGPQFNGIGVGSLRFSADSQRFAYLAGHDGKALVVVDGQPGNHYDGITPDMMIYSPVGKRLAYVASRGAKGFVVVDGKEGPEFDGIGNDTITFSPDGQRLAYATQRGSKGVVVVVARPARNLTPWHGRESHFQFGQSPRRICGPAGQALESGRQRPGR